MPQTLSFTLVHIIFSTKSRQPLITPELRNPLYAYLSTITRNHQSECFRAGGIADHVHLAVRLHPTNTLAKLISELKANSSKWMKAQGVTNFSWHRGYGAFSVSPADMATLSQYIDTQETHHRQRDYQTEMRAFLEKYHVAFDEKYVWD